MTCLQFNSKFVITSSDDGTVKLWDVKTGELVKGRYKKVHLTLMWSCGLMLCCVWSLSFSLSVPLATKYFPEVSGANDTSSQCSQPNYRDSWDKDKKVTSFCRELGVPVIEAYMARTYDVCSGRARE